MNGVIYCRVSSKEQAEGTSLESQELACREYARAKNIKILKTFIEQGESAKFADRTQLLELIDFCRDHKGQVQLLLVWKVDRFARNVGDHFNVKATLLKYGVRIVSVTEPIDSNPEGKLMETILAGFAQFDNDIRATRTVQGMRRKLQEGIFPWKPPLGYLTATKNGEKKTQPDQPDQPLFGLLQRIWEEFATGAYTKAAIRRLMEARGILTKKGKTLSAQSLDNLFGNAYYAGILVDPWSGEEYQGQHIPMVSRQTFAQVQQVIARRNRSVPHQKERPEFPLRGLARCSHCQRFVTGSFSRGRSRRYPYYHCQNRACPIRGKVVPAKTVHDEFESFLTEITPKRELLEKLGEAIVLAAEARRVFLKSKQARVESALARIKRETQELIRMRAQGLITDDEFLTQKRVLAERRMALEGAHTHEVVSQEDIRARLAEISEPLSRLTETWKALQKPQQGRFERLLLPAGFVTERIRTADLGLLFRALGDLSATNSTGVALTGESWNRLLQEILEFARVLRGPDGLDEPSEDAVRKDSRE